MEQLKTLYLNWGTQQSSTFVYKRDKGPLSLSVELRKWEKRVVAPEVNIIMGRKIGCELLVVVLVTLFHFWLACVTASSTGLRKLSSNHEEQLRRNLLANGLGTTPPMGYVCVYYNLYSVSTKFLLSLLEWVLFSMYNLPVSLAYYSQYCSSMMQDSTVNNTS